MQKLVADRNIKLYKKLSYRLETGNSNVFLCSYVNFYRPQLITAGAYVRLYG